MHNVNLNFGTIYKVMATNEKMSRFIFETELLYGGTMEIVVEIKPLRNLFLNEFLNLAFGPVDEDGYINDFAAVPHLDYSKAFSTVLFCGFSFLTRHANARLGINGSDFRRTYLYFRILQHNYDYLTRYFHLIGIKYFVRLLQGADKNKGLNVDPDELLSVPCAIERGPLCEHKSLFNYFMFSLNLQQ